MSRVGVINVYRQTTPVVPKALQELEELHVESWGIFGQIGGGGLLGDKRGDNILPR